ncbi:hypothetical protein CANMA_003134 [Candida margitis]|uniref:uncharacterized protein n=1 Tax=Candida margitis TaxID=1775924 RepID=UPI0022280A5D|nr:uncharacterized protein CANMA_003134 [Candida margitis]KAI5967314.1 hypothetical protein CANMA_003134 [Candida margitis]
MSGNDADQRKLLYQKYGYEINKLIRDHEKFESKIELSDGFNVIDEEPDKQDYQQLLLTQNKPQAPTIQGGKRKKSNNQGFRNFIKVSLSFRNREDSIKRQESSWLLKDTLKSIKHRSQKLDPFIKKWFTPSIKSQCFMLRFIEFGQTTPPGGGGDGDGDITAIMSDATHKIAVIFPRKSIFQYLARGNLPFNDAYSINNYMLIRQAHLKFVSHEFMSTHFNLDLDKNVRYCVLQVLQFEFMYSVEYFLANRVEGAPPLEKVVNENGSQYEVYDQEDFDLGGGINSDWKSTGVPKFDKLGLKLIYNNEFYRKLCRLKRPSGELLH